MFLLIFIHLSFAILAYNYAIISYKTKEDEINHFREKISECRGSLNESNGFTLYDICFWKSSIYVFGVGAFIGSKYI